MQLEIMQTEFILSFINWQTDEVTYSYLEHYSQFFIGIATNPNKNKKSWPHLCSDLFHA